MIAFEIYGSSDCEICMNFKDTILSASRPNAIRDVSLPRRVPYTPSPEDWRDQVIYFLLPDRFSDGQDSNRPLLDPQQRQASRPAGFRWDDWAASGGGRYQGGTLQGVISRLDYIRALGATTLWLAPTLKNRANRNDFHGYAIQDFLEVDPRLGTRADLVQLVSEAHSRGMYVMLDIVFNHTGDNWIYANGQDQPPYRAWPGFYEKGQWRDAQDQGTPTIGDANAAVWPVELQRDDYYTRAGEGDLGAGDFDDPHAEFRRTDFCGDRDINYDGTDALSDLARCYKYWIALTDVDALRIETLKHVDEETGRNFCGSVKEFAANLGKANFFLVGEVAGGDTGARRYLDVLGSNLDATLDIGESEISLRSVAKGLAPPSVYFDLLKVWNDALGSHRNAGKSRVTLCDDHDLVLMEKLRFSSGASSDHQVVAAVAIQLFSLGIPCIYYGTEQALAGPELSEKQWLPNWGGSDVYLREAMFGPKHPRAGGLQGLASGSAGIDAAAPGFGAFGTTGAHCFNPSSAAYVRIANLIGVRQQYPVLRYGRQYQREISNFEKPFALPAAGELIAWSRLLDDEEALCIVNGHGNESRGADVIVDSSLNTPGGSPRPAGGAGFFLVVANSAQAAAGSGYSGTHPVGQQVQVRMKQGATCVEIRGIGPSEVLVLINRSQ
jgi:glycosidase